MMELNSILETWPIGDEFQERIIAAISPASQRTFKQ